MLRFTKLLDSQLPHHRTWPQECRVAQASFVATRLGMTATTVAVTVHRLRHRYRQLVREAVRPTVADPAEVEGEVKHLVAALSSS